MTFASEVIGLGMPSALANGLGGQYAAVTATGSSQTTATDIGASMNVIASADGTKGVQLPAVEAGAEIWLFNNSGSTCPVYPDSGAAICVPGTGLGSANSAFSLLTYKTGIFKKVTATQWLVCVTG